MYVLELLTGMELADSVLVPLSVVYVSLNLEARQSLLPNRLPKTRYALFLMKRIEYTRCRHLVLTSAYAIKLFSRMIELDTAESWKWDALLLLPRRPTGPCSTFVITKSRFPLSEYMISHSLNSSIVLLMTDTVTRRHNTCDPIDAAAHIREH